MLTNSFVINNTQISFCQQEFPFEVASFPYPYLVSIAESLSDYARLFAESDFIIIDQNILSLYPIDHANRAYIFTIEANERNKNMDTVLALIDSMIDNNISKGSRVLAIGGGIVQDISACACSLFRRGQPFSYLPTTTLGQLDSCVGAKCAINTSKSKNIIGLFSAPRRVFIPSFMVKTMPLTDHRAGLSEMLRLCLTASDRALDLYEKYFMNISYPSDIDLDTYRRALSLSLSIKKSVVDFDEYEKNIRRSMNYGHTFGHALEKLVEYAIPHGIAVLIGMHMANSYSHQTRLMARDTFLRITNLIRVTLTGVTLNTGILNSLETSRIIEQFKYDKKGDGTSVPLILIKKPGLMIFHRHSFDTSTLDLEYSISSALNDIVTWLK